MPSYVIVRGAIIYYCSELRNGKGYFHSPGGATVIMGVKSQMYDVVTPLFTYSDGPLYYYCIFIAYNYIVDFSLTIFIYICIHTK